MKRVLGIWLVLLGLSACGKSTPVLLSTPAATATPAATPTCYVVIDMTSSAMYPVEFVDDFERTIRIELAGELLVEFVCQEETCPITFTIPPDAALGSSKLVIHSGRFTGEYDVLIQASETVSP